MNFCLMREPSQQDFKAEQPFDQEWKRCQAKNICPTCENKKTGTVYIEDADLTLYEDVNFVVKLEQKPRRSGHTIILFQNHYEDLSEFPLALSQPFATLVNAIVQALKTTLGAKKVYIVSMCDGGPNHLHYQLIPRFEGESHGKHVFASERQRIKKDMKLISQLKATIQECI